VHVKHGVIGFVVCSDCHIAIVLIWMIFYELRTWLFLLHGICCHRVYECLSICLSRAGIVLKPLNVGSCKQCHMIASGFLVPMYDRNDKSECECVTLVVMLIPPQ